MKYKLIATDMDDTLLDDNHVISEENKEAITQYMKNGNTFVLVSGRPVYAMRPFAEKLKLNNYNGYILGFNGAEIIDCKTNETIYSEGLTKKDLEIFFNEANKKDYVFITYHDDTIYGNKLDEMAMTEVKLTGMKFQQIENIDEFKFDGSAKCMIISTPENVKEMQKKLKEKYDNYFITTSKPIFLEITNKKVNKGKSLKKLCERIGITSEEIICVGDGHNDVPMLEIAGLPAVVENASDEVKKVGMFITTSNNNHALKTIIEKFC